MRPAGGAWFRYGEPLDFARITRSDKLSEATTLAATRERERRFPLGESKSCDCGIFGRAVGSGQIRYWVPLYDSRRS